MSRGNLQIRYLRNIIKLKRFCNSGWFVGIVGVAIFLSVFYKEQRTAEENFETLRLLAFSVVFMVSFGLMSNLMNLLFSINRKTEDISGSLKSRQSRVAYAIGFMALVVLIVLTDFSAITFWAIAFGLFTGVVYSLFLFMEKGIIEVWNRVKQKIRRRQFDEFTKRK